MLDKYKDQLKKPLHPAAGKAGKPKTRIEREENEDLEVDEGLPESGASKAEEGLAETPDKTGAVPKVVHRQSGFDDPVDIDESDPEAVYEEMRSQDA